MAAKGGVKKGGKVKKGPFEPFEIKLGKSTLKYEGTPALGHGYETQVLPGQLVKEDGSTMPVAIKYTKAKNKEDADRLKADIRNLAAGDKSHSNLVKYYGCTVVDLGGVGTDFAIITAMELMECSLLDLFFEDKKFAKNVTYKDLLQIFLDVARGLEYLHQQRIVHYDLKTGSILASKNGRGVKIGDYGGCKILGPERISITITSKRNIKYKAPEISLVGGAHVGNDLDRILRVTQEIDIYSFGCVMWECANLLRLGDEPKEPYASGRQIMFEGIGRALEVHCYGPRPLCDLIEKCLKFSYTGIETRGHDRPTPGEIAKKLEEMLKEKWVDYKVTSFTREMEARKDDWFLNVMDWFAGKRK